MQFCFNLVALSYFDKALRTFDAYLPIFEEKLSYGFWNFSALAVIFYRVVEVGFLAECLEVLFIF